MRLPHPIFIQLRPEVIEKIIENIEAIQTDIHKIELIIQKPAIPERKVTRNEF